MKLKEYIQPTSEVVSVQVESAILASSPAPGVSDGNSLGDDYDAGDITYTRKHFWESGEETEKTWL